MVQEMSFGKEIKIHFSATTTDSVRGILATSHVFLKEDLAESNNLINEHPEIVEEFKSTFIEINNQGYSRPKKF